MKCLKRKWFYISSYFSVYRLQMSFKFFFSFYDFVRATLVLISNYPYTLLKIISFDRKSSKSLSSINSDQSWHILSMYKVTLFLLIEQLKPIRLKSNYSKRFQKLMYILLIKVYHWLYNQGLHFKRISVIFFWQFYLVLLFSKTYAENDIISQ